MCLFNFRGVDVSFQRVTLIMVSTERERIYGGLGAVPPMGSRGEAPGQRVWGASPPEADVFSARNKPFNVSMKGRK